ncbi:hypothetical protein M3193_02125 [Sporosarcina luteola]|uniref:hypothetical protein n=1 Tax=Sporosarcina luteola TaxID=582850 RepID=UPI00203F1657|nr:hypothetical protein [Sporosarcina luteola]MCM3742929.1 hypothetical protein [Sporosarcina luteola]
MAFSTKYLSDELAFYIETAENDYERRSRSISVKIHLMGGISLSELDSGTVVAKRAISEYNRTIGKKEGTYTEEMYVYGTPFRTAFAYITENQNFFFTRLKYAVRKHGEKSIDFHRMGKNYSADSVVAIYNQDHTAIHNPLYVTYHSISLGILRQEFKSKKELKNEFKLSDIELNKALEIGTFFYQDSTVTLKIVKSSIEPSFEEHKRMTEGYLESLERSLVNEYSRYNESEVDLERLCVQIQEAKEEILAYEKLIQQDSFHNVRVMSLKEKNPVELWGQIESELKALYDSHKEAIKGLLDNEPADLFIDGVVIDYSKFLNITPNIICIDYILKSLIDFEHEMFREGIHLKKIA